MTIHHVFACKSNVGDWLSARAIQALLAPDDVIEYLCDEPFIPDTLAQLERVQPTDVVVIGGGGLFMDYFTPFWDGLLRMDPWPQVCIWGVGYCDIKDRPSRAPDGLLRRVVQRSTLCYVRDELTRAYLAGESLPAPIPCPAISAVPSSTRQPQVLHAMDYAVVGEAGYEATRAAATEFASRTGRGYSETNNLIPDGDEAALAHLLNLYSADVLVSSRLHGCIIGLASGCSVVAIAGDRKVESFMDAAGLSAWVIPLDRLDGLDDVLSRVDEQQPPRAFIDAAVRGNRTIAAEIRALAAGA